MHRTLLKSVRVSCSCLSVASCLVSSCLGGHPVSCHVPCPMATVVTSSRASSSPVLVALVLLRTAVMAHKVVTAARATEHLWSVSSMMLRSLVRIRFSPVPNLGSRPVVSFPFCPAPSSLSSFGWLARLGSVLRLLSARKVYLSAPLRSRERSRYDPRLALLVQQTVNPNCRPTRSIKFPQRRPAPSRCRINGRAPVDTSARFKIQARPSKILL